MKRLFLTLLCFLIFCGLAEARMLQGVAGSQVAMGGAGTLGTTDIAGYSAFYAATGKVWCSGPYVQNTGNTATVQTFSIYGAGGYGKQQVAIYSGSPTTMVGTAYEGDR